MDFAQLVKATRTVRRYRQSERLGLPLLRHLVDLGRLSASGGNKQPLKYVLVETPEACARLFPLVAWAGALKDWGGPAEGERPAAYVILLHDKDVSASAGVDHGIAAQTMALAARERSVGSCMMGSIQRPKIKEVFDIGERFDVLLVLALGKDAETVVLDPMPASGNTNYWRDEKSVHHVPKRALDEVIVSSH